MNHIRKIFCLIVSFIIVVVFIRATVLGLTYAFLFKGYINIKHVVYLSYDDIDYAAGLALFFGIPIFLFRKRIKVTSALYAIFTGCIILSVFWSLINVQALKILNTPINYQLWYYADILGSDFVTSSIGKDAYIKLFAEWLLWILILFCLKWLLNQGFIKAKINLKSGYILMGACAVTFVMYSVLARRYTKRILEKYDLVAKIQNPVVAFVESVALSYNREEDLFKSLNAGSSNPYAANQNRFKKPQHADAPFNGKVKNVILFVLESVSAPYIAGYNGTYDLTPQIQKHLPEAVLFKNIYAHNPNSSNALFSLVSSAYPYVSFKNVILEHPDLSWPTLPSVLKEQNYKTAFFTSTDSRYAGVNEFLAQRRFDKNADYRDIPCNKGTIQNESEGVGHGKNENCMVDAFTEWIKTTGDQPFFGMLWTIQTHYPYFNYNSGKQYETKDKYYNRYLNAISETDAALGNLLDFLKQQGLSESTLVVVVGDHGEAFGQHQQFGHGANIYEENIHVPLLFINPLLFKGEEKDVIGGQLDIAPTILNLLHLPAPADWQGVSLFDTTREESTYFFSTWSDYLFGFRKNEYKAVFNIYKNKIAVYNLLTDPGELHDLSGEMKPFVDSANDQLSQWVQYQRLFSNKKLQGVQPAFSK